MKARKRTSVTLQLLWLEYKERYADGIQYSQFCELYRGWRGALDLVLRQEHRGGEKVLVDFACQTVPVIDCTTGEVYEAKIFVGVLGASNFTYAQACRSQELPEWVAAHIRMYEYFGGVPKATVPDYAARHIMGDEPPGDSSEELPGVLEAADQVGNLLRVGEC